MIMFINTQIQISPCIASKARYALNLKNIQPNNNKKCSFQYWTRVIETLKIVYGLNDDDFLLGLDEFENLIL